MTVDLLVVSYNTKDLLKRLFDTLSSDWEPDVWNLLVRDNNSTDGSYEFMLEAVTNPDYHIKHFSWDGNNIGYSKAINHLASTPFATGDILCAVNADTWFTTRHVKQVIQSFNDRPQMAICGVKQMDEQSRIRHGGILWDGVNNPVHRGWGEPDPLDAKYRDVIQCWTVSGSIYYIRRSVWDEMTACPQFREVAPDARGGFLPTPHFFEETYFSVHAQHHGYGVWYDGSVDTAGHTWHAASAVGEASAKYFETSRKMYIQACDHHGIKHECEAFR